jgi:uncharacterized protein YlxW (UPF0749 family)
VTGHHQRRRSVVGTAAVAVVLTVAGVLFATSAGTAAGTDLRKEGPDLPGLVRRESAQVDARSTRVAELRAEVDELSAQVDDAAVRLLQARAAELAGPAQVAAVRGPGLTVTLDDAPADRPLPPQAGPDDLVVHQQDVQAVVNALWAGGAEAMMLMDQRVISTSAVRCVGTTLHLQGRVYSPPYTITAIGGARELQRSLDASEQVDIYREYVQAFDLAYTVEEHENLELPPYDGPLELQHAAARSSGDARYGRDG